MSPKASVTLFLAKFLEARKLANGTPNMFIAKKRGKSKNTLTRKSAVWRWR
jgi:hypothetical protein